MSNEIIRTAETIAEEINIIKSQTYGILNAAIVYAKRSCFEIGKRLEEAKTLVPHGEWGAWLEANFEYSESTATNMMRIYREFGDEQVNLLTGKSDAEVFEGLSQSQLVELFALPKPMRVEFVEEHRAELEDGEMSVREMRELIRTQKQTIERQEEAIRENDDSYSKLVEDLRESEKESSSIMEEARKADKRAEELEEENENLREEIEELKNAPKETQEVNVVVHEPSSEQIEKIRAEALAEAEEKHKGDIERLSADLNKRDEHHAKALKEAEENAEKKIRQLLQKSDPHTARVTYCMEAVGRALNDINAEVNVMEQENPGSGLKMRMQCESMLLRLLNKCGWQV